MSDQEDDTRAEPDVVNEAEAEAGVVDEAIAVLVTPSAGDIPGAALTEPLDKHLVAALRW